ncbi:hypothetical protein N0V88_006069 [Collariella sp. IMI 366227]|nr:hypothetical protein N0V88_006069 [Collariella sp. IMI 366227]
MASPNNPPVIVVGAGLAGLSAAYSALQAGAPSVRLLERAAKPGGNSIKASSGINGAPTRFQNAAKYGVDESFWDDTVRSAGTRLHTATQPVRHQREALISTLTNRSASAVDFLVDLGVELSVVAQLGGHSKPRTHRGAGKLPPGAAIVTTLLAKLKESDRFSSSPKQNVQIHPTGFVDPANPQARLKFLAAEMLRGGRDFAAWGRRVVNELETRERVSNVIMGLEGAKGEEGV